MYFALEVFERSLPERHDLALPVADGENQPVHEEDRSDFWLKRPLCASNSSL